MLAGLSFQVASILLFATACADFFMRVKRSRQNWEVSHAVLYETKLFKFFLIGKCAGHLQEHPHLKGSWSVYNVQSTNVY
jgi:hypothetical protein